MISVKKDGKRVSRPAVISAGGVHVGSAPQQFMRSCCGPFTYLTSALLLVASIVMLVLGKLWQRYRVVKVTEAEAAANASQLAQQRQRTLAALTMATPSSGLASPKSSGTDDAVSSGPSEVVVAGGSERLDHQLQRQWRAFVRQSGMLQVGVMLQFCGSGLVHWLFSLDMWQCRSFIVAPCLPCTQVRAAMCDRRTADEAQLSVVVDGNLEASRLGRPGHFVLNLACAPGMV